jgi:transcriptional antiterminator RfaH
MPILAAEPDRFPIDVLDRSAAASGQSWWVLHSKPRQEKSLARFLHAAGLDYYLPLVARRHGVRGRILTAQVPLFTGYVFLWGDREQRGIALSSNRIVQTLNTRDSARLTRDLRQIDALLASGAAITPESRLMPGDVVEISSGPLAGLTGTIVRTATARRFVVTVDFIQQGASVLLDDHTLVPVRTYPADLEERPRRKNMEVQVSQWR